MESIQANRTMNTEERHAAAERIVDNLPGGAYTDHYQPDFGETQPLVDSVQELLSTTPATTPTSIDALSARFEAIVTGASDEIVVIDGNCAEPVSMEVAVHDIAEKMSSNLETELAIAVGGMTRIAKMLRIKRGFGQSTKPRTKASEAIALEEFLRKAELNNPGLKLHEAFMETHGVRRLPEIPYDIVDGDVIVPSFMGHAVNDDNLMHRNPDPRRMVGAADQARDLEELLRKKAGHHVPAAHEALLLPYEHSFEYTDPDTDKQYLLSADLPWIGVRTNGLKGMQTDSSIRVPKPPETPTLESAQIDLLRDKENPIGVKIDHNTTAEHLRLLVEALNPQRTPGKLVLMPRIGVAHLECLPELSAAIANESPEVLIVGDPMHGNTVALADGRKTRLVSDITKEAIAVSAAMRAVGLRQHGVHLETTDEEGRKECIDTPGEVPDKSLVDPQLNRVQKMHVLKVIAPHLLAA